MTIDLVIGFLDLLLYILGYISSNCPTPPGSHSQVIPHMLLVQPSRVLIRVWLLSDYPTGCMYYWLFVSVAVDSLWVWYKRYHIFMMLRDNTINLLLCGVFWR